LPLTRIYDPDLMRDMTDRLVQCLAENQVPAIGFVNENKLYEKSILLPERVSLLQKWLSAGLELGNHTFSHVDYNNMTTAAFIADIQKGEIISRPLAEAVNRPYRFFRHPYLHRGNTPEKVVALTTYLKNNGYIEAPVTIDNGEWIFAHAYHRRMQERDSVAMRKIATDYIRYMEAKTLYFEEMARKMFGRAIPQILLLHANALNADHMDALLQMFRRLTYTFVPFEVALKDAAYLSEDTFSGRQGISWLHRWAKTANQPALYFEGEPMVPRHILDWAGISEE
ncbi:MAG TPA: polysaccharide deacetylase family protein, partial [Rhodothermales bacterium]|nr:polysaccharide deacetylase family protein [Rhodothermales bacterium]